ncbi:uncharacterized protein LOC131224955 [Magnolia sinica]|uniref:uncharacterized protein LOC131224955 n=1 Tax=Magnolia sinica TaxID=86752 RepID=UPI002658964C|nr:uncharacterized protein LOC131224955 [Magnolia sinica]
MPSSRGAHDCDARGRGAHGHGSHSAPAVRVTFSPPPEIPVSPLEPIVLIPEAPAIPVPPPEASATPAYLTIPVGAEHLQQLMQVITDVLQTRQPVPEMPDQAEQERASPLLRDSTLQRAPLAIFLLQGEAKWTSSQRDRDQRRGWKRQAPCGSSRQRRQQQRCIAYRAARASASHAAASSSRAFTGICYGCGQTGHQRRECPLPLQQRQWLLPPRPRQQPRLQCKPPQQQRPQMQRGQTPP